MILSCQNIKKQFGDVTILERCSFHIEDYEKAAIVGVNGAGKTTLLRIIMGSCLRMTASVHFQRDVPSAIFHSLLPLKAATQFMTSCSL